VFKFHEGSFARGTNGAIYRLRVSNGGTRATNGTALVEDRLPKGVVPVSIAGDGWNCVIGAVACSRADSLAPNGQYPIVTLTVNVTADAADFVTNTATVSGGGESNTSNNVGTDMAQTSAGSGPNSTTTTQPPPGSPKQVRRLAGPDRIATAISVSRDTFTDGAARAVVLARAADFPDALAASPLAATRGGPLLLSSEVSLDSRVLAETERVLPRGQTVFLAGGVNALSPDIEAALRADGYSVVRFAGHNRFETATLIAESVDPVTQVVLVTGTSFADALSGGAAAGALGGPLLLTNGGSMPPETAAYLAVRPKAAVTAIGGGAAAAHPSASTSIVGPDRFQTSALVARRLFRSPARLGVVSGTSFADGLPAGAVLARQSSPLLLTPSDSVSPALAAYIADNSDSLRTILLFGGTNALSQRVEDRLRSG
jgi:putative cell wall-binding protein